MTHQKFLPLLLLHCATLALTSLARQDAEPGPASEPTSLPTADGYRGIWYFNQPSNDEYKYKYSGGMATYPQQHIPIAIHAPEVNKTFFVYGGTTAPIFTTLRPVNAHPEFYAFWADGHGREPSGSHLYFTD